MQKRSPRLGIDTAILQSPPSGTGLYVQRLLDYLPEYLPDWEILPLAPPEVSGDDQPRWRRLTKAARWNLNGIARAAGEADLDLLHIPLFSAPFRSRSPLILTVHDLVPLTRPEYRATKAMQANLAVVTRTARRAQRVIVPSQYSRGQVEALLGIDPSRIRVIPMAADPGPGPRQGEAIPESLRQIGITGRYLFNVGGFDARKQLPVLIEAVQIVKADPRFADLQLVIAGAPHTSNPHVFPPVLPAPGLILTGKISDDLKWLLHQHATLYVTPSLEEGFGITPLEAMSVGVPVIVSNTSAFPEVLGQAAELTDPNPQSIAAAIIKLLTDANDWQRLAAAGLQRATYYSWTDTARLTAEVYRELTGKRQ